MLFDLGISYLSGTTVKTVGSNKNPDVMLKLALHFQNARQVSRFSALAQNF